MDEALDRFEDGLRVIALVASAGGLAAVSEVLSGLPADLDAAVVVLIHQQPDRENKLVQILGRRSRLPVEAARDHSPLRAGTVVVAPPGKHVVITTGPMVRLIASGTPPPSRPSADLLLSTLAAACGPRVTAVVLSGGGHDGATGATAVHHLGGTVLASSELTSDYFSMPRATIERGSTIDKIVPIGDMAALLASSAPHRGDSQRPAHEANELVRVARERERVAGERAHIAEEREELAAARERLVVRREHLTEGLEWRGERLGEREAAVARRERLADERERIADERERIADERERIADDRETLADVRELTADERERGIDRREGTSSRELARSERREESADKREHLADERDRIADERERLADVRERAADQRERLADEREGTAEQREVERRERAEAANERQRQAQRREQEQINRETAATGREMARDAREEDPAKDSGARDGEDQVD